MAFLDPYLSYLPKITGIYSVSIDEDAIEVNCALDEELESTSDVTTTKGSMPPIGTNISTAKTSRPTASAVPTNSILGSKRKACDTSSEQTFEHSKDKKGLKQPEKTTEELFALSLVPALQRMSRQQNALARMRIQQVLYEIEFGNENWQTEVKMDESSQNIAQ